jgi:protein SCO1/2
MAGTVHNKVRVSVALGALVFAQATASAEDVTEHHAEPATRATISSIRQYVVPDVKLIRDDGVGVSLPAEMNDGRPVVVNFIFTTCGSICPLMSQVFGQLQRRLGADGANLHLISISTDPEEDTPGRLREYARQFGARQGWNHYTGTLEASQSAQRAFDVYRGDKMSHTPVTLMRASPGRPWLRIEGFTTPDELLHQYHELLAAR